MTIMKVDHVGLVCRSEKDSDRFFKDILGLAKENTKIVSASLASQLFLLEKELKVIAYKGEKIKFEVFINESEAEPEQQIGHVCLECSDIEEVLNKGTAVGLRVRRGEKEGRSIYFIEDFDSHLYELK